MSEENVTQGEGNEEQEVQTVTAEQFEALNTQLAESQKMFEDLKKAQSGADSKVTELQKLLKLKEQEAEEAGKTQEQKFADRLAEIENELESTKSEKQKAVLKSLAMQLLGDKGVKAPKYLERLIGQDAEETEALITEYIEEHLEIELSVADKFAKNNGRKIEKGKSDVKTIDDYSDDEIRAMSNAEWAKIKNRSK